jgi:hypothetical protein
MPSLTRKNLSLQRDEQEFVNWVRSAGTAERWAFRKVSGLELSESASEAEVLRAIFKTGMRVIEEQVTTDGYAALAASRTDADTQARDAVRRRGARYRD